MIKSITIETSAVCNLKCTMCPTLAYTGNRGIMNEETFQKVFREVKEIKPDYIDMTGWGEPLLDKNIFERISMVRRIVPRVCIISNATLLHQNNNISKLVDSGITEIVVSFDGATKETYEKIRKNSNFSQTIKNLKNLSDFIRSTKSKINIKFAFVVMQENKNELDLFVELLESNNILYSNIIVKPLDVVSCKKNFDQLISRSEIIDIINKSKYKEKFTGVNLCENKKKGNCLADPSHVLFITYDGMVSPCCNLGHPAARFRKKYFFKKNNVFYKIGDINKERLIDIWNKHEYENFRNTIKQGKIPHPCKYCNLI